MKIFIAILGLLVTSSTIFAAEPKVNGCSALASQATLAIAQLNEASSVLPKTRNMVAPLKTNGEDSLYSYSFEAYNSSNLRTGEITTQVILTGSGQCFVASVKIGADKQ